MHHALIVCLRHPSAAQHKAVHVFRGIRLRVGGQLLQPHHDGVLAALPVGFHVLILHRLHGFHPVHRCDGGDVLFRQAQRGQHPQVEHILLHIVFLPGAAHVGRNAHQAGQHHHAQRRDAEQRDHAAQVALHLPQDVFAITLQHDITTRSPAPEPGARSPDWTRSDRCAPE